MNLHKTLVAAAVCSAVMITTGCSTTTPTATQSSVNQTAAIDYNQQANQLFDDIFKENVMASPEYQTYLGIKQDYGKWDPMTEAASAQALARSKSQLARLGQLDSHKLDPQTALSLQLFKQALQNEIDDYQWRYYNYPLNQMYGVHSNLPSFLINQHQIDNVSDAKAYISRLQGIPEQITQLDEALKIRAQKGIIAPKFVFPYVISDSQNIIKGAPFTQGQDSPLWADFKAKVAKLDIDATQKQQLLTQAKNALIEQVKPAYQKMIRFVSQLQEVADNRDGVWKFPQGQQFYNNALKRTTTTDLDAQTIHQLGLSEVARIHNEMRQIMQQVNFNGSLAEFFVFMREDPQFYYANDASGKAAYLKQAKQYISVMESRLDEVFNIKPKASMIVKPVEAFREKSAGKAFYNAPTPDGSRPGTYYANLYDMKAMPSYQMEALAYHEGTPGHHMQIAIAQELEQLPQFRRFGSYTAYIEGWGLYSEYFPKEMGMYQDPYSDFGRLAMELWRACRLVVDTGIHTKQWNREQAIAYYMENTPNAESDAIKMVERHIVMPSQATAYKIGMLKILELRTQAQQTMGAAFDIREFHTQLLKNGPLPLDVLEQNIKRWSHIEKIPSV